MSGEVERVGGWWVVGPGGVLDRLNFLKHQESATHTMLSRHHAAVEVVPANAYNDATRETQQQQGGAAAMQHMLQSRAEQGNQEELTNAHDRGDGELK